MKKDNIKVLVQVEDGKVMDVLSTSSKVHAFVQESGKVHEIVVIPINATYAKAIKTIAAMEVKHEGEDTIVSPE